MHYFTTRTPNEGVLAYIYVGWMRTEHSVSIWYGDSCIYRAKTNPANYCLAALVPVYNNSALMKAAKRPGRRPKPCTSTDPLVQALHKARRGRSADELRALLAEHGVAVSRAAINSWLTRKKCRPNQFIRDDLKRALDSIAMGKKGVPPQQADEDLLMRRIQLAAVARRAHGLAILLRARQIGVADETVRGWLVRGKKPNRHLRQALSRALDSIWPLDEGGPLAGWNINTGHWPPTNPEQLAQRWNKVLGRQQRS